jgi:CheY-like chemotaxis protein
MARRIHDHMGSARVVLVVDDEPLVRLMIARVLARNGLETIQAASMAEALEMVAARRGEIGVVLSDLRMPSGGGGRLARQLGIGFPEVPIVLMSAMFEPGLDECQPHVREWLTKPLDTECLAARLNAIVSGRKPGGALSTAGTEGVSAVAGESRDFRHRVLH